MKIIAVIPARMASTRPPGKPMVDILGMPMIGHCYKRAEMCELLDLVYVATCDKIIYDYIRSIGGNAIMTSDSHERARDRAAEAMLKIEKKHNIKTDILVIFDDFHRFKIQIIVFFQHILNTDTAYFGDF